MVKIESGSATSTPLWLLASAVLCFGLRVGMTITENLNPPPATAEIHWQAPDAIKKTDNGDKLVFYDFQAQWCEPCKQMEKTCFQSKDIVAMLGSDFVPVRVTDRKREEGKNAQAVQNLEDKFSISAFPTLVVAMPDGTKIIDHLGAANSYSLKKFLQESVTLADYFRGKEQIIAGDAKAAAASFDSFIEKTKWQHWRCCFAAIFASIAHRELGENEKADSVVKNALQQIHDHTFPYPVLQFLAGNRSFDDLLKDASENKTNRILCYAYAGMESFARKEFAGAREKFDWVAANCDDKETFEYRIVQSELNRLKPTGKN